MTGRILRIAVCIGFLPMTLSASAMDNGICRDLSNINCHVAPSLQALSQLSLKQLRRQAEAITVRVMSDELLGSGIILRKEGNVYTVLTNAHVLRAGTPPYRIQTPDRRIHPANLAPKVRFGNNDLAILQFQSVNHAYEVASLGASPSVEDEVFATGFPFAQEESQEKGLMFTSGKVLLVLNKALEGGYQVGYTNEIEKGMSGGPLLNRRGEVVGINGLHAYPLWDTPSVFIDGLEADEKLHQKITRLSWAVPIDKAVKMIPKTAQTLHKAD